MKLKGVNVIVIVIFVVWVVLFRWMVDSGGVSFLVSLFMEREIRVVFFF